MRNPLAWTFLNLVVAANLFYSIDAIAQLKDDPQACAIEIPKLLVEYQEAREERPAVDQAYQRRKEMVDKLGPDCTALGDQMRDILKNLNKGKLRQIKTLVHKDRSKGLGELHKYLVGVVDGDDPNNPKYHFVHRIFSRGKEAKEDKHVNYRPAVGYYELLPRGGEDPGYAQVLLGSKVILFVPGVEMAIPEGDTSGIAKIVHYPYKISSEDLFDWAEGRQDIVFSEQECRDDILGPPPDKLGDEIDYISSGLEKEHLFCNNYSVVSVLEKFKQKEKNADASSATGDSGGSAKAKKIPPKDIERSSIEIYPPVSSDSDLKIFESTSIQPPAVNRTPVAPTSQPVK